MLLNDSSWQVRAGAAMALGKTADSGLAEILDKALLDENPWVRLAALYGLQTFGK